MIQSLLALLLSMKLFTSLDNVSSSCLQCFVGLKPCMLLGLREIKCLLCAVPATGQPQWELTNILDKGDLS